VAFPQPYPQVVVAMHTQSAEDLSGSVAMHARTIISTRSSTCPNQSEAGRQNSISALIDKRANSRSYLRDQW